MKTCQRAQRNVLSSDFITQVYLCNAMQQALIGWAVIPECAEMTIMSSIILLQYTASALSLNGAELLPNTGYNILVSANNVTASISSSLKLVYTSKFMTY